MTESATRKFWLTRRRVIAGAVVVLLVLAVAGFVFGVFGDSEGRIKATVVGFEKSLNGKSTSAVITLSNGSHRTVPLETAFDWYVYAQFRSPTPTGGVGSSLPPLYVLRGLSPCPFPPGAVWTNRAELPDAGRSGWLAIPCSEQPRRLLAILKPLDVLWRNLRPQRGVHFDVVCDQEIQCPLLRPDGTVQPPRLVLAPEKKR